MTRLDTFYLLLQLPNCCFPFHPSLDLSEPAPLCCQSQQRPQEWLVRWVLVQCSFGLGNAVNHTLCGPAPHRRSGGAHVQWGWGHSAGCYGLQRKRGVFFLEMGTEAPLIRVALGRRRRGEETYLFLLLIEVVDDDADEQVQGEEGAEDDEDDEVDVHVDVVLVLGLLVRLRAGGDSQL